MTISKRHFRFLNRLDQIGVALIPLLIGLMALLNDVGDFHGTLSHVVNPLITMHHNTTHAMWRALPSSWAPYVYIILFLAEFSMAILTSISLVQMFKHINATDELFEQAKRWVYLACGWGIIVWGLGFFVIGGDWFLAWKSQQLATFQQDGLHYVLIIFVVFVYLKLIRS